MNDPDSSVRVLQVLEASLGGTRRYVENVFGALGEGSNNGLVYSLHRADSAFMELLEELRDAKWQLFEVDMRREVHPGHDLRSVKALRRVYRSFKPTVVHAHSSKAGAIARLATIGMPNRPGIVYTPNSIGANLGLPFRLIEHVLALRLDVLAAVTPSERDELRALRLIPRKRIHVVNPTIDPIAYAPVDQAQARRELQLPDVPLVIGIGRLAPQKDPLAFVDFVAELLKRVPNALAIWVGGGEMQPLMEVRIDALGLRQHLTITGWISDVRPYLAACDLLVSTAAYESFGYVAAEAFAMERPVVASAITGTVDVVVTDTEQQLYKHGDVVTAALLAERFLTDRSAAVAAAGRGRSYVLETFSVPEMRRGLDAAYAAATLRV
jgi:glycosyltransferase involved in cell wall biosynthesis